MKRVIVIILAIVVGGFAGSWIKNLPGFLIIVYEKTSYEVRLGIALCLFALFLLSLYFVVRLIRSLVSGVGKVASWHGGRNWRRSRKLSIQGILAFAEGRWKDSEEAMRRAAKISDYQLINYLIAAQAAQQQNAETRRDAYLAQAYNSEPTAKTAIGLTQAQLQLQHNQFEQALASLHDLRAQNPNHPYVLKLLSRLYEHLHDWKRLVELLPELKKNRVLDNTTMERLEYISVAGLFKQYGRENDLQTLEDTWQTLPSSVRKKPANVINYVCILIDFKQMDEAEVLLRPVVKKNFDEESIGLYGDIHSSDPTRQLTFMEGLHKSHQQSPDCIFLSLGKIAFNAELWGKARSYLEQALHIKPETEAYLFMARTLTNLDDIELAQNCYLQGLEHAVNPKISVRQLALPSATDEVIVHHEMPKFQKLENKR